jgi:hypothetical protein
MAYKQCTNSWYMYMYNKELISYLWVSDCCLTPNELFFSYIMIAFFMRWWCPFCTKQSHQLRFNSASSLKQQSTLTLSESVSFFLRLSEVCLAVKQKIPILMSNGLIWPWSTTLETSISSARQSIIYDQRIIKQILHENLFLSGDTHI